MLENPYKIESYNRMRGLVKMSILLSHKLVTVQNTEVNKCQLHFGNEGEGMPYTWVSKPIYDKPTTVKVKVTIILTSTAWCTCIHNTQTSILPSGKYYAIMLQISTISYIYSSMRVGGIALARWEFEVVHWSTR